MRKFIFASIIAFFMFVGVNAFAGTPTIPPIQTGCCQATGECLVNQDACESEGLNFIIGGVCDAEGDFCIEPTRNVPALTEWGLIALAGVMGIIAFIILRRKKAAV